MKKLLPIRFAAVLLLVNQGIRAQDLQLTGITSPASGCMISCTADLIVTIYNPGPFIVSSNFDVSYTVNGSPLHTESIFTTITPGGVYTYNFLTDPSFCAAGTYNVTATVTLPGDINPANNSFTATIVNDTLVVPGTLLGADTVCASGNAGSLQLTGYTGYIGSWEYSTNSGSTWNPISGATTNTYNYLNLDTTTIFHVLIDGGYCPDGVSPWVTVKVDEPSNGGFLVSSSTTVCSTANNGAINVTGYQGNILGWQSSVDGGSTFTPISNTTNTENFTNLSQTTIYQVQVQNGVCPAVFSSPVTVTVDSPGSAGTVSSSTSVCFGSTGSLALLGYSGNVTFWLSSTNGGATWSPIANTTASQTYTGLTQTTVYTAIVQNGVCPADTAVSATVTILPLPTPNAGPDDTLVVGDTLCFNATGGFFYQWSPPTFLTDPNIQNPCMIPGSPGIYTYTLTVQDAAGCTGTDVVTITVTDTSGNITPPDTSGVVALVICNFVTPNNDGDNDVWNVIGIDQYPDNEVKIINNHGMIVFEQTAYNNTWNGDGLPDGSYFYLVKIPTLDKTYKGVLTITSSR